MKYVYELEFRQLNVYTKFFEVYRTELYSSLRKAKKTLENVIEVNKGYSINYDKSFYLSETIARVDYLTIENTQRKETNERLIISKKELR